MYLLSSGGRQVQANGCTTQSSNITSPVIQVSVSFGATRHLGIPPETEVMLTVLHCKARVPMCCYRNWKYFLASMPRKESAKARISLAALVTCISILLDRMLPHTHGWKNHPSPCIEPWKKRATENRVCLANTKMELKILATLQLDHRLDSE